MSHPQDPQRPHRSPAREAAIQAALAEMRVEYRAQLPGYLDEISTCIARVQRGEGDADDLARARLLAHRIRGTAGSYGWSALSQALGRVEDTLEAGDAAPAGEMLAQLAAALADAKAAFMAV
ncbi:Hpt domain-containing protein [Chondromyces apiculatus]|uniref:Hpt domain-containing protein n=1 Tax=Chondromyces apiculatus TaxID=51 RepID=UPI0005C5E7C6|nr:Hpt domain-containing protein [Chondromyces apiculatus]